MHQDRLCVLDAVAFVDGCPDPYSNFVVIERTWRSTWRFDGYCKPVRGALEREWSREYYILQDVKVAAAEWAVRKGITRVHLSPRCEWASTSRARGRAERPSDITAQRASEAPGDERPTPARQ